MKETVKELLFNGQIGQWKRRDVQQCNFKNYDLIYAFFCRFPSWGCPVKLRQCAANKTFFLYVFLTTNSFHSYNPPPAFLKPLSLSTSSLSSLPAFSLRNVNFKNLQKLLKILQLCMANGFTVDNKSYQHISKLMETKLTHLIVDTFIYCDILCMILNLYLKLGFLKSTCPKSNTIHHKEKIHYRSYKLQSHPFSLFYIFFIFFAPVFKFTDFESPLVLFSWWRNKISWGLLNQLSKSVAR